MTHFSSCRTLLLMVCLGLTACSQKPASRREAPAAAPVAAPTRTPRPPNVPARPRASAAARPAPKPSAPPRAAPVVAAPETGTLHIESDVPGTQVFIDREYVGVTPVTAPNV